MKRATLFPVAVLWVAMIFLCSNSWTLDITWTRMTGQESVECAPRMVDLDGDGEQEILAINRRGQVMLWGVGGKDTGDGPDGLVLQLPEGLWSSAPIILDGEGPGKVVLCSTEGRVVGLDASLQIVWRYDLPEGTAYGRAIPAVVETSNGFALCLADKSGTATCLNAAGSLLWKKELDTGPCTAPLGTFLDNGEGRFLVPSGSTLWCLNGAGETLWRRDLGSVIGARPEVFQTEDGPLLVCGAGSGGLHALGAAGEKLWEAAIGDELDSTITILPRVGGASLLLCAGLWGNLHAFNMDGSPVWTHLYRAKTRAKPLVADLDGDGAFEIVVATYRHHLYIFDDEGQLKDDLHVPGVMNAPPVPIPVLNSGRTDFLVTTGHLLAYRFALGTPIPLQDSLDEADRLRFAPVSALADPEREGLVLHNPAGTHVRVNLEMTSPEGRRWLQGVSTVRSEFEMSLPKILQNEPGAFRATAIDNSGKVLDKISWEAPFSSKQNEKCPNGETGPFFMRSARPYATFPDDGAETEGEDAVSVDNLYLDEVGQGAFVVASTLPESVQVRVEVEIPERETGTSFGGGIVLREVVVVGTFNGEEVGDALPALGDAGLLTVPNARPAKVWVSVDGHGAAPGHYKGAITVTPLDGGSDALSLPLHIHIVDLPMPAQFPLTMSTWDYLPNNWFGGDVTWALDDMARHGVSVFPRPSFVPEATVNAEGKLLFDWSRVDEELARLQGRGVILVHMTHPPITFDTPVEDDAKHSFEIEYLRAYRDYLKARGLGYEDYLFYPTDEPGYDRGGRIAVFLEAAKLCHEADPLFQVYANPVMTLSWRDFERIDPWVDVWAPNMRLAGGLLVGDPRMRRISERSGPTWSYECIAQTKSVSPLRYNRAYAWRAHRLGLNGMGMWTYCTTQTDPWFPADDKNGEFTLVYPGERPVPSVRWEALRDGQEDLAAVLLLEERMRTHRNAGTRTRLVAEAAETLRLAFNDIMDLSEMAFIESRDFLREGDRRVWHSATDVETYHRHRARIAELTLALGEDAKTAS
jgi:hypothetical protein